MLLGGTECGVKGMSRDPKAMEYKEILRLSFRLEEICVICATSKKYSIVFTICIGQKVMQQRSKLVMNIRGLLMN